MLNKRGTKYDPDIEDVDREKGMSKGGKKEWREKENKKEGLAIACGLFNVGGLKDTFHYVIQNVFVL